MEGQQVFALHIGGASQAHSKEVDEVRLKIVNK